MQNPPYTYYILNIYDLLWLGFIGYQPLWVILIPNPFYTYVYIKYIGFGLVGFYDISTIVCYLMPNPFLYIYILNIYDLVWLDFMAYQPLCVI